MNPKELAKTIATMLDNIEKLIPVYMQNEADGLKAKGGHVAICIIDVDGRVFGRMFGVADKIIAREAYRVAWLKASQVWVTGMRTGEYEKLVFNNEVDEKKFGIRRPDFIGWEGGQPIILHDGTQLSAGFSGFTGATDLEIVIKALPGE
jgi:uncharacterized protein GlcG (DUF336 family)